MASKKKRVKPKKRRLTQTRGTPNPRGPKRGKKPESPGEAQRLRELRGVEREDNLARGALRRSGRLGPQGRVATSDTEAVRQTADLNRRRRNAENALRRQQAESKRRRKKK